MVQPTHYNDGGYSGGSMERPVLVRLLADIQFGTVDVVVVYKVDRLTPCEPVFDGDFEKGAADGAEMSLKVIALAAESWRARRQS